MTEALFVFFFKMGYLSIPLFAVGYLGWYQVIFLLDFFWRESLEKDLPSPQEFLQEKISKDFKDRRESSSFFRNYLYLLQNTNKKNLESELLEFQRKEIAALKEGLFHIRIACAVAPLLGLLGTINGIAAVFSVVSGVGSGSSALFSDGISEALLTTQTGLIIAFPLLLCHTFVKSRLDKMCKEMQIYHDTWQSKL